MKKKLTAFCAVIALIFALTGCDASSSLKQSSSDDGNTSTTTYKLGISAYPAFYTWYIAEAEGFFEKNGINVELVYFPVYSDSVQAFSTGRLDMLSLAMPDVIAPFISGIELETVLVLDNSFGADGLVANSSINSIADLKGKSIATEYGTIEHFFLLSALQTAGLTESDINFVNLSISDSAPAYLSDKVDAACLWEPSLSLALEKEGSNLLISSEDTPGLIPDVLIVDGKMAKNAASDIEKIINAYYDSMEFYVANEDKAIQDMATGAEITFDEMKVSMSGSKLFTLQEGIDTMDNAADDYSYLPYTTAKIAEFLKGVKMIDEIPADTTKIVNSKYMRNVLETRPSLPVPNTKK
ncbi:sulfonate ABC transporter substrate-binding protein [Clostridia bacterium]|nr:sulfonate ABC transporter substrate-binding protein [Clostridia bacterium]